MVADAQAAEDFESDDDENDPLAPTLRGPKWKQKTLAELFGGATKVHVHRMRQAEIDAEPELMADLATAEAEAEAEEDSKVKLIYNERGKAGQQLGSKKKEKKP
ncbi:hypothetical protein C8J57DRAFT_1241000 [Mycena rebaudengoi]|nr:hypothetical protein C8J57DRAFT_1241000 [Mycena rebaudengoi]